MIRHIVLLTLRAGTSADSERAIVDALRALPDVIPSIRDYQVGVDLGIVASNATVAATGTFDDEAGYMEYRNHLAHREVIEKYVDPVCETRTAIQFEI